jgi:hypothetical protein
VSDLHRHADPDELLAWTSLDGTCISTVAATDDEPCETIWGKLEFAEDPDGILARWEWDGEDDAIEGHDDLVESITDIYCEWWPPRDQWPADLPYESTLGQ